MAGSSNGNRSVVICAVLCGITAAIALGFGWWVLAAVGSASATATHLDDLSSGRELGPWQQAIEARIRALEAGK